MSPLPQSLPASCPGLTDSLQPALLEDTPCPANHKGQAERAAKGRACLAASPCNSASALGRVSQKLREKGLVTRCLLPPLLLALSDIWLFDQLVIALPPIRGAGHPWGPLFSLLLYPPAELLQSFGMPACYGVWEKEIRIFEGWLTGQPGGKKQQGYACAVLVTGAGLS